jgi:GAF domain-containing protein
MLGPWQRADAGRVIRLAVGFQAPLVLYACYAGYVSRQLWVLAVALVSYALAVTAALWAIQETALRAGTALVASAVLALALSAGLGHVAAGIVVLVSAAVLATFLLPSAVGIGTLALGAAMAATASWLGAPTSTFGGWGMALSVGLALLPVSGTMLSLAPVLSLVDASVPASDRDSLAELRAETLSLRERAGALEEANARLEGRAEALGALIGIAGEAAAELELDELLRRASLLISQRFGFYHVGIFLVDVTGQWAVLEAASSEAGRRMLARQHRLRVGQEGVVGHVAARGEPRVVQDVNRDAVYYQNPDLPETRSEIAVPLVYEGRVLGVLDVQADTSGAFRQDDVLLTETLAELVVVAIRNARLYAELREAVVAERRSYAALSEEAWQERAQRTGGMAYRYERGEVSQTPAEERVRRGRDDDELRLPELTLPVSVRGRVIGSLRAHKPMGTRGWSTSEREAMETLVAQLDAALESARLYEDTQQLAARERVLARATARMRETLDVQTVLRAGADEVYTALGLEEVAIRLVEPAKGSGGEGV